MRDDDREYCIRLAKRKDYDRYVTALAAPASSRPYLAALLAFNVEIAQVQETVSDPVLGDLRLVWWREAINGLGMESSINHPIMRALDKTARDRNVKLSDLSALIDGRRRDLEGMPFSGLKELEAYADVTSGNLAVIMLGALGIHDAVSQQVARQSGTAWAMLGLLRTRAHTRRCVRSSLIEHICVEEILGRIEKLTVLARGLTHQVSRQAEPVLLINRLADLYRKRLYAVNNELDLANLEISHFQKAGTILWFKMIGRY